MAAWLAFAIASSLHVGNAYWAAMPIWAVSQPTRGLMLERAAFRVLGTLVGALVGFAILALVPDPYLQLALLALWIVPCAGCTHVLPGVHGYGPLLAGMTAGVVVLSTIFAPDNSLVVAGERVMCTLIGVAVVTLVMWLFTPASTPGLHASYRRLSDLCAASLELVAARGTRPDRQRQRAGAELVAALSAVESASILAGAGLPEGYRLRRHVGAMLTATLDLLAAARQSERRGGELPAGVAEAMTALAAWLRRPSAEPLPQPLAALAATTVPRDDWSDVARLQRGQVQLVRAAVALRGLPELPAVPTPPLPLAPGRDWALARRTGLVAGLATFAAGVLGYLSGGPAGELAALGVCIFSMVLGSMPMPQQIAPKLLLGVAVGATIAALYRWGVQPATTTLPWLLLGIAPFLLFGGLARASRVSAIPAMDGNMCFLLGSQAGMPPAGSGGEILVGSGALILGALLVAGGFLLAPRRPDRLARQEAALIADDLEALARQVASAPAAPSPMTARRVLRLAQHVGRAGHAGTRPELSSPLAVLNLGRAIRGLGVALHRADLDAPSRVALVTALGELGRMQDDPRGIAVQLRAQADATGDATVAALLADAADALADLRGLWRLARA